MPDPIARIRGRVAKRKEARELRKRQMRHANVAMSRGEFRTVYSSLGGVMFVAGLSLVAVWANTIAAVSRSSGHAPVIALIVLGIVLISLGLYVLIASISIKDQLRLPHKSAVRQAELDRAMSVIIQNVGVSGLANALSVGKQMQGWDGLSLADALAWRRHVGMLVGMVWGSIYGGHVGMGTDQAVQVANTRDAVISEVVTPTLERLTVFAPNAYSIPVSEYAIFDQVKPISDWLQVRAMELIQLVNDQQLAPGTATSPPGAGK